MTAMKKQFGGGVVTLEDAHKNNALAAEYYKQTQYLMSVAGIAKNEGQAKNILDAMKSGVIDKLKFGEGEDKGAALKTAIDSGTEQQHRTGNEVTRIHNILAHSKLFSYDYARGAVELANQTFGVSESMRGATHASGQSGIREMATPQSKNNIVSLDRGGVGSEIYHEIKEDKILGLVVEAVERAAEAAEVVRNKSKQEKKISTEHSTTKAGSKLHQVGMVPPMGAGNPVNRDELVQRISQEIENLKKTTHGGRLSPGMKRTETGSHGAGDLLPGASTLNTHRQPISTTGIRSASTVTHTRGREEPTSWILTSKPLEITIHIPDLDTKIRSIVQRSATDEIKRTAAGTS